MEFLDVRNNDLIFHFLLSFDFGSINCNCFGSGRRSHDFFLRICAHGVLHHVQSIDRQQIIQIVRLLVFLLQGWEQCLCQRFPPPPAENPGVKWLFTLNYGRQVIVAIFVIEPNSPKELFAILRFRRRVI